MKFSTVREQILPAIQAAARMAQGRAIHAVYSHVQLSLDGSTLSIRSSDGDAVVHTRLPVDKEAGGEMLLPAQKMLEICQQAPDGCRIEVSVKDGKAVILAEKSRFSLAILEDEFPAPDQIEGVELKLPASQIHWLLSRTLCCMAATDFRNYLMGALLHLDKDGLRAVATDTHRLALAEYPQVSHPTGESVQAIVPRRSVQELVRLMDGGQASSAGEGAQAAEGEPEAPRDEQQATLILGEQQARFDVGDFSLQTSLIRGKYPDYKRVMPDNSKGVSLEANAENMRRALRRASIVLEKGGTVDWKINKDGVRLDSHNDIGEDTEQQLAAEYAGKDEVVMSFNIDYQKDIMENITGDTVRMYMFSSSESVSLSDPTQADLSYVLMPLRQ